jgi:hypothetical protein
MYGTPQKPTAGGAGRAASPLRTVVANPVTPVYGRGAGRGAGRGEEGREEGSVVKNSFVTPSDPRNSVSTPPRGAAAPRAPPPRIERRTGVYDPLLTGKGVLDSPAIKFSKQGCVEVEGVVPDSTVFVECMDLSRINYDEVRVQQLLRAIPSFTEIEFMNGTAPFGVYTYLVVTNRAGGTQLVAKQTRTVMELGTCHHSIASDSSIDISGVRFGGELWNKANGTMEFNLLSGDYSWPRLRSLVDDDREKSSRDMAEMVQSLLPFARYREASVNDTVDQRGSFIRPRNLLPLPDRALLDLYRSVDIAVFYFPTRAACMGFRTANDDEKAEETHLRASVENRAATRRALVELVEEHGGHEYAPAAAAAAAAAADAANALPAAAAVNRKTRKQRRQRQRKRKSLKRSARKSRRN